MSHFSLEEQIGFCVSWYAVDVLGKIALFESGGGLLPECVIQNKSSVIMVKEYFNNYEAKFTTYMKHPLSHQEKMYRMNRALFEKELNIRGLGHYEFIENGSRSMSKPIYFCLKIPKEELSASTLPKEIQNHIAKIRFNGKFEDTFTVNNSDFF